MKNNDMTEKVDVLQHIQTSINILDCLKHGNKETIETWRYLKYARATIAEDINRESRRNRCPQNQ